MNDEQNKQKQEYLELFDEIFGTNTKKYIDLKQVPLLAEVYESMREDIWSLSEKYKGLRSARVEIYDAMEKIMTQEHKDLMEVYTDLTTQMEIEMAQQVFLFGVILAKELDRECNEVSKNKK